MTHVSTTAEGDEVNRSSDGASTTREHLHPDPELPSYTRSPRALGRLLVYSAVALVTLALLNLLDQSAMGVRTDARQAAAHLPNAIAAVFDAAALTIASLVVAIGLVQAWMRRWWRLVVAIVVAPVITGVVTYAVVDAVDGRWAPAGSGDVAMEAYIAAAASALLVVRIGAPARWQRAAMVAFSLAALTGGAWATESIPGRLLALSGGAAFGALVALVIGTPSRHATRRDLADSMDRIGLPVAALRPQGGDARGSVPWLGELATGAPVFVKTYGDEERIADLLFRLWRGVRLRESGDARPHSSLLHAVEHEAFAATRAGAAGARVPRVIAMGALEEGGVFAVHQAVDGRSLDALVEEDGPDALTDAMLREAWSMVQTIHRVGVAHRDLRTANLVADADGQIWLVDFAFADVLADDDLRRRDLVELLASTSALVGEERAIDAAVTALGPVAWTEALPLVQPLAVSTATRTAMGRAGIRDLRTSLGRTLGAPEPDLPRLTRVDRRTVLTLVALTAAVWVLLPQVAQSGDLWEQIPDADRVQLALAVVASLVTYVGATASLKGSVPDPLPTLRTFVVQMASSFTNRVTPAKVGGVALNARWLVKEGVPSPVAAAAISVNALGGLAVHITLTVFTVFWAGQVGLGDLSLPSARTVLLGVGLIAAVAGISYAIPPLRQLIRYRVKPRAKQSAGAVRDVVTNPRRLGLLFGGSTLVSACYVAALWLSLAAVGADVPVSTVALVYLAGSALASAAPTPGGLGATEAVFAAALTATGVAKDEALAAVLLYRFVTFWLPILPGWLAFTALERRGEL